MSWTDRFGSRLMQRDAVAGGKSTKSTKATNSSKAGGTGTASAGIGGLASAVSGMRPVRSRMLDYDHALLWVVDRAARRWAS